MTPIALDLGCGRKKQPGHLGFDELHIPGVDVVARLGTVPLPLADNSADAIFTSHFLEHLDIKGLVFMMEEMWRVAKPGARVEIHVPHFSGRWAFYEFHQTFFRINSFREFLVDGDGMFVSRARYRLVSKRLRFPRDKVKYPYSYLLEPLVNRSNAWLNYYEATGLRALFPAWEVMVVLEVVKTP